MATKQGEQRQEVTTQTQTKPSAMAFRSEIATVTNACVESTRQMLEERGVGKECRSRWSLYH